MSPPPSLPAGSAPRIALLPKWLFVAAIGLWGWQTGAWFAAAVMALACLSPLVVARRWDIGEEQLRRVADFCTVLALAAGVILYATYGNPRAVKLWFQWLPFIVAPLPLVMYYAGLARVEAGVLFWSMRRIRERRASHLALDPPWFALWLVASSVANVRGAAFYASLALLGAGALWTVRPRGASVAGWAAILATATVLGAGLHTGLHESQIWLEARVTDWLAGGGSRTDPLQSRTDIGTIGEQKLSSRILIRVEGTGDPLLLHRASYDDLFGATWVARNAAFTPLALSAPGAWSLAAGNASRRPGRTLTISDRSERGNPVLALPYGAQRIENLPASELKRTPLGTVQAEIRPGDFRFAVHYATDIARPDGDGSGGEAPPGEPDLRLPRFDRSVVQALADDLAPKGTPPREAARNIAKHFADHFRYSSWQPPPEGPGAARRSGLSALAQFLTETRAGHCEYFATATVLVARAAGIPARYATGFSAHEWSDREQAMIVRERHAHAWARVWIDGRWENLDTTPPGWSAEEAAGDGIGTALADIASYLRLKLMRLFAGFEPGTGTVLASLPVLAWILLRQLRGSRGKTPPAVPALPPPGSDSPFYRIERRLTELGHARRTGESLKAWLHRLPDGLVADRDAASRALALHYRLRFDPAGLDGPESGQLHALSERVLQSLRVDPSRGAGA